MVQKSEVGKGERKKTDRKVALHNEGEVVKTSKARTWQSKVWGITGRRRE